MDKICPEMLNAIDIVGLSWLTFLVSVAWKSGTEHLEWQTRVVIPILKKGDRRVCSNHQCIKLLSHPGNVYSRVPERKLRQTVKPRIQEEQCGFRPGHGTADQLFTLASLLTGAWEFAGPIYLCFVNLDKAYDQVPWGILWGLL